jgi:hypothetical protein
MQNHSVVSKRWSSAWMRCKIDRRTTREGLVILHICGDISGQAVDLLRTLLQQEASPIIVDLNGVLLVDHEGVKLLALLEASGVELRNSPAYIREWVKRENADTNVPVERIG